MANLLNEAEVSELQRAAKEFAAGIKFSIQTDDLQPLNTDVNFEASYLEDSQSTEISSGTSISTKTNYKSEALRLRIQVTTLEDELVRVKALMAKRRPYTHNLAQQLNQINQTHRLQVECLNEQIENIHRKSQACIKHEENKTTETTTLLLEERLKTAEALQKNTALLEQLNNMQSQRIVDLTNHKRELAKKDAAARDAQSRVQLLTQQIKFLETNRQERLQELQIENQRNLEKQKKVYLKKFEKMKQVLVQIQNLWSHSSSCNNGFSKNSDSSSDTVTVTFVSPGKTNKTTRIATPHSIRSHAMEDNNSFEAKKLFHGNGVNDDNKENDSIYNSTDRYDTHLSDSDTNSIEFDDAAELDAIQLALKLAKQSRQKLIYANKKVKIESERTKFVTAQLTAQRIGDVKAIESSLENMFGNLEGYADHCLTQSQKLLQTHITKLKSVCIDGQKIVQYLHDQELKSDTDKPYNENAIENISIGLKSIVGKFDSIIKKASPYIHPDVNTTCNRVEQETAMKESDTETDRKSKNVLTASTIAAIIEKSNACLNYTISGAKVTSSYETQVFAIIVKLASEIMSSFSGPLQSSANEILRNSSGYMNFSSPNQAPFSASNLLEMLLKIKSTVETQRMNCTRLQKELALSKKELSVSQQKIKTLHDSLSQQVQQTTNAEQHIAASTENTASLESALAELRNEYNSHCLSIESLTKAKNEAVEAESMALQKLSQELQDFSSIKVNNEIAIEQQVKLLEQMQTEHAINLAEIQKRNLQEISLSTSELSNLKQELSQMQVKHKISQTKLLDSQTCIGKLENELSENFAECEQLKQSSNSASHAHGKMLKQLSELTSQNKQLHYDWCASEAAVENLEADHVAMRQQVQQERAARAGRNI